MEEKGAKFWLCGVLVSEPDARNGTHLSPFPCENENDTNLILQSMASPVGSAVKIMPAIQETGVWSLGQEDPLEKEMATHSSILAWEVARTEETVQLQSVELQRVGHDWATKQQQVLHSMLRRLELRLTGHAFYKL